jgi:hypothetical protein
MRRVKIQLSDKNKSLLILSPGIFSISKSGNSILLNSNIKFDYDDPKSLSTDYNKIKVELIDDKNWMDIK